MKRFHMKNTMAFYIVLLLLPVICGFAALFVGRYPLPPSVVIQGLGAGLSLWQPPSIEAMTVLWQMRLPRVIAGVFVGSSLAVSGAAFQGVFRNPLVNSGILGVSQGAGFGASIAILMFAGGYFVYPFAFGFGVLAVFLSYLAGKIYSSVPGVTLILGGVIVSSFFGSLIMIVKYVADPYAQLPAITFWMMGSLASIGYSQFAALLPMAAGMAAVFLVRWKINIISMGDKEALTLGVDVSKYKLLIIGGATLCTASAVCISGIIGWVGLVAPHIGRMIVGNDNNRLIPFSMSFGACFLILVDVMSRSISGGEIPIGILTSLIGAPFFIYLLKKTRGGGW